MKPIFWVIVALLLSPAFITAALFAGDIAPEQWDQWNTFVHAIKGSKGLTQLGLAGGVVQWLLYLARNSFGPLPGKYKILIVQGLSILAGVLSLKFADFDWGSAFLHANTLGAIQVFLHQIIKEFTNDESRLPLPLR